MTVRIGNETDSFEDVIPVEVLASPETVAAYGQLSGATARAEESSDHSAGRRARASAAFIWRCRPRRWSA